MTVVRAIGAGHWGAYEGTERLGALRALTRPDQRTILSFQECHDEAYRPLLAAAETEVMTDLYVSVDEQDSAGLQRFTDLGFGVVRRSHRYLVPVEPTRFRLAGLPPPPGMSLVSAADADLDQLRLLDDELRNDTPDSRGWRWTPEEFREETFSDGFDPATYLVAVAERTGDYVGLVRLWRKAAGPRFGLVGVVRRWRRTRLTYALLAAAFAELHRRGCTEVAAEIDDTNRASLAIAARAGARRVGGNLDLRRAA